MSEQIRNDSTNQEARRAMKYTYDVIGNGPNGNAFNPGGVNVVDTSDGLVEGRVFNPDVDLEAYDDDSTVARARVNVGPGVYRIEDGVSGLEVSRSGKGYEHTFSTNAERAAHLITHIAVKSLVRKNDDIVVRRVEHLQNAKESFHNTADKV